MVTTRPPPHVVFIVVDDLGHSDVGYLSGSNPSPTPTIDRLARSGVILANYYSACTCTPARGALMTGLHPIRLGLQHGQIFPEEPWGLPNKFEILPSFLAEGDTSSERYVSHLVGKWHLGHYAAERLPTARGFATYFGPLDGAQYYSTHVDAMQCALPHEMLQQGLPNRSAFVDIVHHHGCYFDMRHGTEPVVDLIGNYSTELYARKAIQVIASHDASRPLFLLVSFNAVHAPIWVPPESEHPELLGNVSNIIRRRLLSAVRLVDLAVGDIVDALASSGLYENSIVCFVSDNGANPEHGGSNAPLRGSKGYLFEGGVKVPAFLHGPSFLHTKGKTYFGLFHVSDWLPTIAHGLAGKSRFRQADDEDDKRDAIDESTRRGTRRLPPSDAAAELHTYFSRVETLPEGVDLWAELASAHEVSLEAGGRQEVLLNIDYLDATLDYTSEPLGYDTAALVVRGWKCIVNSGELGWYDTPDSPHDAVRLDVVDEHTYFQVAEPHTYLFDLKTDPNEHINLAEDYPDVLDALIDRLLQYRAHMRPCEWRPAFSNATDHFKKTGFIGPFWQLPNPPALSQNCAAIGDSTLDRLRRPYHDSLGEYAPEPRQILHHEGGQERSGWLSKHDISLSSEGSETYFVMQRHNGNWTEEVGESSADANFSRGENKTQSADYGSTMHSVNAGVPKKRARFGYDW